MKCIVGLGNPGSKYAATRHNAGRRAAEEIARMLGAKFSKKPGFSYAPVKWAGEEVVLAYPESFMNVSGEPVAAAVKHFELKPEKDLLILVDEAALPFGRLRLRGKGSDGGHNGLKSIEAALGTPEYARLRIGVGSPELAAGIPLEEYVLACFSRAEEKLLPRILHQVQEACQAWLTLPIQSAMNAVNPDKLEG